MALLGQDGARSPLVKVIASAACDFDPGPLALLEIESKHVLMKDTRLADAAINHHGLLEGDSGVALPRTDAHTVSEDDRDLFAGRVKLQHLVGALANVTLTVEREAAAKNIELVLIGHSGMRLAAFDLELRLTEVIDFFPNDFLVFDLRNANLFNCLRGQTPNQEAVLPSSRQRGVLSGLRDKVILEGLGFDDKPESLSLLKALHVVLDTALQLLSQSVARDVFMRLGCETSLLHLIGSVVAHHQLVLGPIPVGARDSPLFHEALGQVNCKVGAWGR